MNDVIAKTRDKPPPITNKQARIFSTAIAPDIGKYIAENKDAYEAWLIQQQGKKPKMSG